MKSQLIGRFGAPEGKPPRLVGLVTTTGSWRARRERSCLEFSAVIAEGEGATIAEAEEAMWKSVNDDPSLRVVRAWLERAVPRE